MSASFRSHFRSTPTPTDVGSDERRKQSHRMVESRPSDGTGSKSKATQHVSKLAKRASRTTIPTEKSALSTKTTPTPVTSTSRTAPAARRSSVVPPLEGVVQSDRRHDFPAPPPSVRTPSLVSGSSASTHDSPRSTTLRKKSSTIDRYAQQKRADTAPIEVDRRGMPSRDEGYQAGCEEAVLGISLPPTSTNGVPRSTSDRHWQMDRNMTPPVTSGYAPSTTPSTRYSDSPFSHVPTPSSASSYSPAMFATSADTPPAKLESAVRSRPSVNGRVSDRRDRSRLDLPPVRESSTSSSNSTVKPPVPVKVPSRKEVPRNAPAATTSAQTVKRAPSTAKTPSYAKPTASSTSARRTSGNVQIPPELAHLNVEPPTKPALHKPLPPLRPSRDGTPSLSDLSQQTRVVQSDLPPLYTPHHKRTPSQETTHSASSPSFRQRLGLSPKTSSRHTSPRIDSAISPPPSARAFVRDPTPEPIQADRQRLKRMDSPAVGPAPSPSKSPRFGFFSRKPKTDTAKTTEKPKRQPVKGPAAGTGHEGYGRWGFRGRSSSTTSSAGFRSPSADSNASSLPEQTAGKKGSLASSRDGSDLEDFIRERQRPVILRGSGSTFSNTTSMSDVQPASNADSSNSSSIESYKPRLLPSAMEQGRGDSPSKRPPIGRRLPSESSEDGVMYPTLAARRSLNRLSQTEGSHTLRSMPAPIVTNIPPTRSGSSYNADISAFPRTDSTLPGNANLDREEQWVRSDSTSQTKAPRKWNFFQRAQASSRPKGKQRATEDNAPTVAGSKRLAHDEAAHHAMLGPMIGPVEPVDLHEVAQLLQDNELSPEDSMTEDRRAVKVVPYETRHFGKLPSPPSVEPSREALRSSGQSSLPSVMVRYDSSESPELLRAQAAVPQLLPQMVDIAPSPILPLTNDEASVQQYTPEMPSGPFVASDGSSENSPRQPRLSPIGRIPRVVSKRDRDYKLPNHSFSRPFANSQARPTVKPPGTLYSQIRDLASPIESTSQPVSSTSTHSEGLPGEHKSSINTNPPSISTNRTSMDVHSNNDLIAFAPRKDSEVSYSSSSGNGSWLFTAAAQQPQLDDPWLEYNDLLDEFVPQRTPISAGSSLGAPFQYSSVLCDPHSPAVPTPLLYRQPPSTQLPVPPRSNTVPAVLSVPQQIAHFMKPSMSPLTSPYTLSDLYDTYGNRSSTHLVSTRSSLPPLARESTHQLKRASLTNDRASIASSRYSRASRHSRSASLPEGNVRSSTNSLTPSARFKRDTQLLDIAEHEIDSQTSNANLRFAALMTSKYLSFGRVMFSPAHNEMRLANDPKVLVIDGLGSDWSYYVALSYPQATVYNLGSATANGSTAWPGINQKPPPNHKQTTHVGLSSVFPFPKGFFTAVLFRFPVVNTDEAYQACIYECKRVLKPGGHLEVVALDLDLNNMGSRARSTVRGLKTRMQQDDCDVSLKNMSDLLVRLLGRRGFEEVQRCVVGVPTAGRIPRSRDISRSSGESSARRSTSDNHSNTSEQEVDFAALMEDASIASVDAERKGNDEGITKMVAKVARWWYSACYETALLPTDKSIWKDQALLRECEKQATSFRLLICHAQKPAQARRRTVSV